MPSESPAGWISPLYTTKISYVQDVAEGFFYRKKLSSQPHECVQILSCTEGFPPEKG